MKDSRPLEYFCEHITSGGTPPSGIVEYYGGSIPWLRTQEVTFNRIYETELTISEAGLQNSNAKWIPKNSVIVAMYGNSAGRVAINAIPLTTNQACCNLIIDSNKADYRYIYYALLQQYPELKGLSRGAAQNNLNASQVREFRIPYLNRAAQTQVADVLSNYDELIDKNRRRITLLEEAARQLYQEWFVRLRFPGHEKTKIVDGVPEGWQRGTIGNIATLQNGFAFKSSDWQSDGVPVIKIGNITPGGLNISKCDCVGENIADSASRFEIKPGELLIAMTGATVGKVGILPLTEKKHLLNQRVGVFKPKISHEPTPFLFTFFNSAEGRSQIANFAGGAAQPNISGNQIEGIKLLLPPEDLLKEYVDVCGVLFRQRLLLERQGDLARQARNLLLPRLMSGEITI